MKKRNFSIKDVITDRKDIEIKNIEKPKRDFKKPIDSNEFFAQYRDPRWQKKRLEIMDRDEYVCTSCGTDSNTLNIHHLIPYRKDTKPWEYENDELTTLCEDCHRQISEIIKTCNHIVASRCWCLDSSGEMLRIMEQIDGSDIFALLKIWKTIDFMKSMKML